MIQQMNNQLVDAKRRLTRSNRQLEAALKENKEINEKLDEARLLAEKASLSKSRFLANMSHDIRTPMNAILGFTDIAKGSKSLEQIQDCLHKIGLAGDLLLKLINEILNISRIESGTLRPLLEKVDLQQFARDLEMLFKQSMENKQLDFRVLCTVKNRLVEADSQHMQTICVNLIANAQKFTPAGGKVAMCIEQLETQAEQAVYRIQVSDTGIGMSEEFQKVQYQLFERERTTTVTHTEGTGLGLAIVKRLVDMLEGRIECESQVGKGTTYSLYFTLKLLPDVAVNDNPADKQLAEQALAGKEVLLVEDNELNMEIAQIVLAKAGIVVDTAENGKEAVAKASAKRYDVILMDIQMPVMNGYEATRAIRQLENKELAQVPIIAMTANAFQEDKEKALNEGMDGHVAKPLNVKVVMQTMQEALLNKGQK